MEKKYLDETGLSHMFQKLKEMINSKLPLSGGVMTGNIDMQTNKKDILVGTQKANVPDGTAVAGGIIEKRANMASTLPETRSFIGSFHNTDNNKFYNLISVRHRNGYNDGNAYGMYLYSVLTSGDSLRWNKQISANVWQGDRVLLDSANFTDYALPKDGTAVAATKLQTARTINGVAFDGSKNITVPLRSCYAYDDSSTFADTPWHKVASISLTGTNVDRIAIFHVDKGWTNGGFSGILRARIRVGSTAGQIEDYSLTWEFVNDGFIARTSTLMSQDFILSIYNDTTTGKAKANLWVKITSRYDGWQFTLLSQGDRVGPNNGYWTLINSSSGVENTLDGMTLSGQTPSFCSTIGNPIKYMYVSDIGAEIETTRANLQSMAGTLDSGWRTLAGNVKYRKIGNIVEVRGTYTAPTSGGGMTIGTLPRGYRPSNATVYNTNSISDTASKTYYTSVNTSGTLIISSSSGSTFTKDSTYNVNIMFMVG